MGPSLSIIRDLAAKSDGNSDPLASVVHNKVTYSTQVRFMGLGTRLHFGFLCGWRPVDMTFILTC